ncbi:Fluconazole resistance protein 1 [Lithohypha guttulata]|uniref:Fluconazole resistance protein 1 n=1 Tax=Lithohypha guttulata TaxID=1690604 RepID=A0AAN7Y8Z6_9EURO|nr:Fluconazole resistance protein 1 [Lithohypha guttulata]KAK5105455.1 Fluconazole resistance protein 1 [Lithohypha guttulata]
MGGQSMTPPAELPSSDDNSIRKRVCKACDRCRLKKSKCDGASPCGRCRADNAICVFGERKKSHDKVYPKGYVEMLESQQAQLVAGIQELYRRLQVGEGWEGPRLKETAGGTPLTHEILDHLGALKHDNQHSSTTFEDSPETLQSKLSVTTSASVRREMSFDTSSSSISSPMFEPVQHNTTHFTNPWTHNHFPPTPPLQSPRPSITKTSSPLRAQMTNSYWPVDASQFVDSMDYNTVYDSPAELDLQSMQTLAQAFFDPTQMSIHPSLTMYDPDERLQRYY